MVPDGYGVCYNPMDEHINIAITAFNSCEETNAAKFARAVEDALLDMRALLEDTASAKQWSHTVAWHCACGIPVYGSLKPTGAEVVAKCHISMDAQFMSVLGIQENHLLSWF